MAFATPAGPDVRLVPKSVPDRLRAPRTIVDMPTTTYARCAAPARRRASLRRVLHRPDPGRDDRGRPHPARRHRPRAGVCAGGSRRRGGHHRHGPRRALARAAGRQVRSAARDRAVGRRRVGRLVRRAAPVLRGAHRGRVPRRAVPGAGVLRVAAVAVGPGADPAPAARVRPRLRRRRADLHALARRRGAPRHAGDDVGGPDRRRVAHRPRGAPADVGRPADPVRGAGARRRTTRRRAAC